MAEEVGQKPSLARKGSFSSLTSKVKKGFRSSSRTNGAPGAGENEAGDRWETASNGSTTSRSSSLSFASKMSATRDAMKRRLTAPLGGMTFGNKPKIEFSMGDHGETATRLMVQAEEALDSDTLAELQTGTAFKVLHVGEASRVKILTNNGVQGWINTRIKSNEVLVGKCSSDLQFVVNDFEVGGQHQVKSEVTVRVGEALDSEAKAVLKAGTVVSIMQFGTISKRRVKVSARALKGLGVEGWISMVTKQGELLIGTVTEGAMSNAGVEFVPKFLKVKGLLEAAVNGDLPGIKKLAEGGTGMLSRMISSDPNRPDLNCSDVRGMTALMYAATFTSKSVVEYLVARREEVDVNALDNTQKSALHHGCKRAKSRRAAQYDALQSDIITILLQNGACLEGRDHNGCTALMFAVANGDEAVTLTLLKASANVNVQDYEGRMPLDYALNFGHKRLALVLKENGAEGGPESDEGGDGAQDSAEAGREAASRPPSPSKAKAAEQPPSYAAEAGGSAPGGAAAAEEEAGAAKGAEASPEAPEKRRSKKGEKGEKGEKRKNRKTAAAAASAGMMEAIEVGEQGPTVAAIEESAQAVDEKQLALAKLKTLLEGSATTGELKAAIKMAQAAGAQEAELQGAELRLKELKARGKALEKLQQATADRGVAALQKAIADAQEAKVPADQIEEAKRVLAEEEPKQKAREKLQAAKEGADMEKLKSAIAKAKKVGLGSDELGEFEELLACAESKEKAEAMLKSAMEEKDVDKLKFSIQQAKDAGVDSKVLKSAKQILKEEEPKQNARSLLVAACQAGTTAALRDAIQAGEAANLEASELKEARDLLKRVEEKERRLKGVKDALLEVKDVNNNDVDLLRAAKEKLSGAIDEALKAGVSEADLLEAETRRKKLHNAIEDLKGSIRVFCRVRPLSSKEKAAGDKQITKPVNNMTLGVEDNPNFQFDAVFTPGTQAEVFEDCRDLVQSAVDGYNVTMFAYGQTGAGKTYTMYGAPGDEGTAPRTIKEIFRVTEQNKSRFNFTVMGSMLELYQNDLVDLLSKGTATASKKKLNVRQEKSGMVIVEHLTEEECHSADQLSELLERGNSQRTVAATAMNSESSRSHLVLLIKIVSVNKETKEQLRGKILICDLAGSERLKKSQVTEEAQKEAIEINKSLTALGDVIEGLTKGQKMIPYRNHKLTQLMQDSLGGSAKTLMFVNCSPASSNVDETVMSLKYATRAKKITNTAKKG